MQLIFRNQRLNLGDFPDLVPQRFRVAPGKRLPTAPTSLGFERNDGLTLIAWKQQSLMLEMTRLAAPFFPRSPLFLVSREFGVRMFAARWQRRIARRFLDGRQLGFQDGDAPVLVRNPGEEQANDGLCLWRLTSDHIFLDERCLRHTEDVAYFALGAKANCASQRQPGREPLRTRYSGLRISMA
jgi:hypothetical protein